MSVSGADVEKKLLLLRMRLLRAAADSCLSMIMAEALPGLQGKPQTCGCQGGAPLGANTPTGHPQVEVRSHDMGPGRVLFQHLLGRGHMPGTFALHRGCALVEAVRAGEAAAALPDHRPRITDLGSSTRGWMFCSYPDRSYYRVNKALENLPK